MLECITEIIYWKKHNVFRQPEHYKTNLINFNAKIISKDRFPSKNAHSGPGWCGIPTFFDIFEPGFEILGRKDIIYVSPNPIWILERNVEGLYWNILHYRRRILFVLFASASRRRRWLISLGNCVFVVSSRTVSFPRIHYSDCEKQLHDRRSLSRWIVGHSIIAVLT